MRKGQESCSVFTEPYIESCERCGYVNDTAPVKCEKRNQILGYRCYKSIGVGRNCDLDIDCRIQKCIDGICVSFFTYGPRVPTCPFTNDAVYVIPIKGTIRNNACDCPKPDVPTINDAKIALDGNQTTAFMNS